jgi:hypothetical protein
MGWPLFLEYRKQYHYNKWTITAIQYNKNYCGTVVPTLIFCAKFFSNSLQIKMINKGCFLKIEV